MSINRELQRSRQHLITAREEERRRIRRDLHDGLGPSLATLAMRLETAHDLIADDPDEAAALVGRLSEQARDEIAEVRRLVDGLRPPALDQFGLVAALRHRADEDNRRRPAAPARSGLTWSVDADDDVEPLPAAVEVAAYLDRGRGGHQRAPAQRGGDLRRPAAPGPATRCASGSATRAGGWPRAAPRV